MGATSVQRLRGHASDHRRGAWLLLLIGLVSCRTASAQESPEIVGSGAAEPAVAGAPARPDAAPSEVAVAPPLPGPDYLRAFLENSTLLLGGTVWYWIDDRNIVDWDFDSWEQRFSEEAYRFDNNEFPINFIGHALSGAAFYGLPRANRVDVFSSFAYGLVTSFIWEFFLEFQERFSLNDSVVTPLGGLPIGEGLIRLGRWLDNRAHPALAWMIGWPVAIHEAMDGRSTGRDGPDPSLEDPGSADVLVDAGFAWAVPGGDSAAPGFDLTRVSGRAAFVALPSYRRAGDGIDAFFDAELTRIRMDALFSSTGAGFELEADTVIAGVYIRDLRGEARTLRGTSVVVGTSVSHFYRFENFGPWHERLSYTGFPGLALELSEHFGSVTVGVDVRAQGIFGGSGADHDFARWQRLNPGATPKSILARHQYWYGWGWLARGELHLGLGAFRVVGRLRYLVLDSQEGFDRNEALVTLDADGYAQLLELGLEARLDIEELLTLRARWVHQRRVSELSEARTDRSLDRIEIAVGAPF